MIVAVFLVWLTGTEEAREIRSGISAELSCAPTLKRLTDPSIDFSSLQRAPST